MNIDNLTYGELKQIAAMFSETKASSRIMGNGEAVIIRARDAGVHYGHLVAYDGRTVWLSNSRRMWKWFAKEGVSLSGCATAGIDASKSKIEPVVPNITILDACEIIYCTEAAAKTIEGA